MNMALDEVLLESVCAGRVPPTLRLYRWSPATISLGYFQAYAEFELLAPPAGDLPMVRRLTGGGAILHDQELTYSLTLPIGHELLRPGPTALYPTMHEIIRRALSRFRVEARRRGECREDSVRRGPFFCFSRHHCEDLVLGEGKIAGSAQRRTRAGILQHGSVILGSRYPQQECAAAGLPADEEQVASFAAAVADEFSSVTRLALDPTQWSARELSRASDLVLKYQSTGWNRRY